MHYVSDLTIYYLLDQVHSHIWYSGSEIFNLVHFQYNKQSLTRISQHANASVGNLPK
jgi:hypothetical protein